MAIFQKAIVSKYLKALNENTINQAFTAYNIYFKDHIRLSNIMQLKEENYQEGYYVEEDAEDHRDQVTGLLEYAEIGYSSEKEENDVQHNYYLLERRLFIVDRPHDCKREEVEKVAKEIQPVHVAEQMRNEFAPCADDLVDHVRDVE